MCKKMSKSVKMVKICINELQSINMSKNVKIGQHCKSNQVANLHAGHGNHRHQTIAQSMAEMYQSRRHTTGAGEFDKISPECFQHLRSYQAHHQRNLEQRQ